MRNDEKLLKEYSKQAGEEYQTAMQRSSRLRSIPKEWENHIRMVTNIDTISPPDLVRRINTLCAANTTGQAKMDLNNVNDEDEKNEGDTRETNEQGRKIM